MSTPTSASGQPTSFKTNVNRAKTKRWVEAKSYSYDGDDWGDIDDYDEYGGYDEPPSQAKPTGLRQRGQSATQKPEENDGEDLYQSPISQDRPLGGTLEPSGQQTQHGRDNTTHSMMQRQPPLHRSSSYDPDDELRTFSTGLPQQARAGTPNQMSSSAHQGHNVQGQTFQTGQVYSGQSPPPQLGPVYAPGQFSNRKSMENQPRQLSHPPPLGGNTRGPWPTDQARLVSTGSSAHSMTSNTSSTDFHDRRDFSPSAVPPPLQTRNSPSPHNDSRNRPPRKSSLSQQTQPSLPSNMQMSPSAVIDSHVELPIRERASSSSSSKALPFVRPADIYRRMEEEKERERKSQESSRSSVDALLKGTSEPSRLDTRQDSNSAQLSKPRLDPVSERKSEYGFEGHNARDGLESDGPSTSSEKPRTTSKKFEIKSPSQPSSSHGSRLSSGMMLPDPTRISGFGEGFGEAFLSADNRFGQHSRDSSSKTIDGESLDRLNSATSTKQDRDLQHQPSKGFTSAVHQAFETAQDQVPPTPSSTANSSVGRSASGGTSTVSPIMSRGPSAVERNRPDELPSIDDVTTPTRDETEKIETRQRSAGSFGTLTQASVAEGTQEAHMEPPPPGFKMGHRRDSSTPSPDNSPARTPALASMSHLRHPQEADVADTTPTPTDSTPSTSNSLRDSEPFPEQGHGQSFVQEASNISQSGYSKPSYNDSHSSHAQPLLRQRADSANSGRVKNLADKFEGGSRPESTQSNTTPRASVLGSSTAKINEMAPPRPVNERIESFRPQLPGGWESSASIAPTSAPSQHMGLGSSNVVQDRGLQGGLVEENPQDRESKPSGLEQVKDASTNAFSAAAEAGSALAGALAAAVGVNERHDSSPKSETPSPRRDRNVSINTALHPETSQPWMPNSPNDDSDAPTPLPKDSPRQLDNNHPDYFTPSQKHSTGSTSKGPILAKQPTSLPALSTDVKPQHYESDRLRREIVRELSPGMHSEPTTAESDSPYQAPSRQPTDETTGSKDPESGALPSEYDSYWNDDSDEAVSTHNEEDHHVSESTNTQRGQGVSIAGKSPDTSHTQSAPSTESQAATQPAQDKPHTLVHRFSWEQPLADLTSPSQSRSSDLPSTQTEQAAPASAFLRTQIYPEDQSVDPSRAPSGSPKSIERSLSQQAAGSNPKELSIAEPTSAVNISHRDHDLGLAKDEEGDLEQSTGLEVASPLAGQPSLGSLEQQDNATASISREQAIAVQQDPLPARSTQIPPPAIQIGQLPPPPPPANSQPKLPAFREIMAVKTAGERIRGFNDTQRQFAEMNTGLAHWLAMTIASLPEHGDIVTNGGRTGVSGPGHKPSPSRAKLGGLISSSQTGQPYYQQYLDATPQASTPGGAPQGAMASSPSQGFSPSSGPGGKSSSQQVQAKSKELLHSAGVFGGKANVAAKGLFSKGKSKLRDASGSKKASPLATPTTPGFTSRGMQPQHATSHTSTASTAPPRGQPNLDRNLPTSETSTHESRGSDQVTKADSERDAPSIQSLTQSQLADDERSEDSTAEQADRLPRSSKIYRKSESPARRKSRSNETALPSASLGSDTPQEPYAAERLTDTPERVQSPRSTGSSNKTPTQATFDQTKAPDLPPANKGAESPQDLRSDQSTLPQQIVVPSVSVPQTSSNNAERRSSFRDTILPSVERNANPAAELKSNTIGLGQYSQSQESEAMYHTAASNDSHVGGSTSAGFQDDYAHPDYDLHSRRDLSSHQPPALENILQPIGNSPSPMHTPKDTLLVPGQASAIHSNQTMLRLPSQDFSVGRPSIESLSSRIDLDRPPSPLSPQLPIQMTPEPRGRAVEPVHHGIDHDFGPESDMERARRRSSSFSRPFNGPESRRRSQGPDLDEHPAFRQRMPLTGDPATPEGSYPNQLTRDDALMPRPQAPEYALDEGGPPDLPSVETKSRSRRGSRSSAFFKSLTKSFTDSDSPPMPNSSADHLDGSPTRSSTNIDKKSKRSSIFRLRKSQTDLTQDGAKSNEIVAPTSAPRSRSSSPTQLAAPPAPPKPSPWADDDEFPMRPKQRNSMGLSKKIQRASTAGAKNEEGGKRKQNRFSAIGSLFGRSGQRRQNSTEKSQRPSGHSREPSQQVLQPTLEAGESNVRTRPPAPATRNLPEDYKNVARSDQPPHEGYYAPRQGSSHQYARATTVVGQRVPSSAASPIRQDDAPAYFQDASIRQQSSPPTSARAAKSARTSVDFFRKASQAGLTERPSAIPSHESKGSSSSWTRFSSTSRSKNRGSQEISQAKELTAPRYNSFAPPATVPAQNNSQQEAIRSESPPPPPPPPKDEWHRARPRQSSLEPPAHQSAQASQPNVPPLPSPNQQQRQYLPQLLTNVPSPHLGPIRSGLSSGTDPKSAMTPEEKRRSRQLEIETGHMSPSGIGSVGGNASGKMNAGGLRGVNEENGGDEDDEKIEMSATSFPGQEWQPRYSHAWTGD